jgi:serine/threonine protein kinase
LDDTPFLVTPFILGGNINDYIQGHPSCDRLKYVSLPLSRVPFHGYWTSYTQLHQTSLGLAYLHTQGIIHGNVKGSNILIDDNDNAILCDYGLASLKADANSRVLSSADRTMVSPSWAAPELFMGASLSKACDIYSFGMTIYEVCSFNYNFQPEDIFEFSFFHFA